MGQRRGGVQIGASLALRVWSDSGCTVVRCESPNIRLDASAVGRNPLYR